MFTRRIHALTAMLVSSALSVAVLTPLNAAANTALASATNNTASLTASPMSLHLQQADQLITQSGFASLIKQLPLHFERGVLDAHDRNPSINQKPEQLLTTARQSMARAQVQQQLAIAVARALSGDEIEQLLAWYSSSAGQHISSAQAHAASEDGFKAMMAQVNKLLQNSELTATAERLENLIGFNEFIIDMQEYHAMAEYSTASLAPRLQFDLDAFGEKMKQRREELQFNAEQLVLVSMVYAFRDSSDNDLTAYEHFLQQPLTQLYLKAAMRGLEIGMQKTVNNWLIALGHK